MLLKWRILDFTLESTVSFGTIHIAHVKWTGFLATLQHFLDSACASSQCPQERYKRDFDQSFCKGFKMMSTSHHVFIDVLGGVTKTLELGHAVEGAYRVLGHDQHTVVIQRNKLIEMIIDEKNGLSPSPTGMSLILLESTSAKDVQNKILEGTTRLFLWMLDPRLIDDSQSVVLLKWGLNYEATW